MIRLALPADVEELTRLINQAYRVEDFFINGDRTFPAQVQEHMRKGSFLVAEAAGRIVATLYLELQGERGYFGMLAVDPSVQKQGWGRRLITAAEERCRAAGCRFLDLVVVDLREELAGYYRRLGFAPLGTAPFPEPAKLTRPAQVIQMTKPLVGS